MRSSTRPAIVVRIYDIDLLILCGFKNNIDLGKDVFCIFTLINDYDLAIRIFNMNLEYIFSLS